MKEDCHDYCQFGRYCRKWKTDGDPNACEEFDYWDKISYDCHDDDYDIFESEEDEE